MNFKEQSLSLTLVLASGACLALWFRGADSDSNFLQQAEESDGKPQEFHPEALVNYESLRMGIRESIGPAILVEEPAAIPEETFRAALLLQRWPDHAPLAEVRVNFFGDPGPAWTKAVTTKKGHLELPEELATATCLLRVRAEGFEPQEVELHVSDGLVRLQVVSLVPTHGYLGRVLSPENSPLAGRKVEGWWIEAPRPYEGARHERVSRAATLTGSAAGRPDKLSEATRDLDDVDDLDPFSLAPTLAAELEAMLSGPAFLCARDTLAATTLTNAEGWFYVEALGGAVTGQLTLYCQDEAGSNMRM